MSYFIDLFSPATYEAFLSSSKNISGFREGQKGRAKKIKPGDYFVCYITKISRWAGILEISTEYFFDDTPIFQEIDDPFTLRFKVKPIILLPPAEAIPIFESQIWDYLTFTKGLTRHDNWNGILRGSLAQLNDDDGNFLKQKLSIQTQEKVKFPLDETDYKKYLLHKIKTENKILSVSIPEDIEENHGGIPDVKESIQIQTSIAEIGEKMGFKIWIPSHDRNAVQLAGNFKDGTLIDTLPLNYDLATMKTIEQIDVIWLRKRSIARAFEVEHTTAIYSGLLRMADLLALQPNMDINLHIVAPSSRREKVFEEIQRPIFSLLEKGPLSNSCSFISYESIKELKNQTLLQYLSDEVLDEFKEDAD
jgi:predicted RNA-binding protein